jgi:hypothetical protein
MRISYLVLVALSATACYKPEYASNPDARMGFRCHKSDSPACPPSFVCCLDGVCGDDLKDADEGWCVPPPTPVDMAITGLKYWPFPSKANYFDGEYMPAPLSGYDDQMQWLCTRDDTNPEPPAAIRRMGEPNDFADLAIVLPNPLRPDLPVTDLGSAYQICPDKTAPDLPDVDVYKFKLMSPAKVIAEIKYKVVNGDLDIAIFRLDTDPDTGEKKPTLASPTARDTTSVDNACIEMTSLAAGTYYVVVRGVPVGLDQPGKYTMNNYNLRVFTVDQSGYSCVPKKDGGP